MFYRRKIIFALLELLGGEVEKTRLQKLLFLYSQKNKTADSDFVPYRYGCYSFSTAADLNTMVKKKQLSETETSYQKAIVDCYFNALKPNDKRMLKEIVDMYASFNLQTLVKHTYINYPYFAIKSEIAKKLLNETYFERIAKAVPNENTTKLFTIGYEGISLEAYLNKLLKNNIKLLIDVRKNPLSMKFGFSKSSLSKYCNNLGIKYLHIPEVGIDSSKRQTLNDQSDYDSLFEEYTATTLKTTLKEQHNILGLLVTHQRVALTCFEAEPCQCHRTHLAKSVSHLKGFDHALIHL